MNLNKARVILLLCAMSVGAHMVGCNKEEPPQQPVAPTTSQTAQVERPQPLRPDQLNLAPGAQFPAERIPVEESPARAIAALVSAFARGDDTTLRNMLDRADVAVLDELIESGSWRDATDATQTVRVCTVETNNGIVRVALGFEDDQGAYLLAFEGVEARGDWKFKSLAIASPPAARASDLDGTPIG